MGYIVYYNADDDGGQRTQTCDNFRMNFVEVELVYQDPRNNVVIDRYRVKSIETYDGRVIYGSQD